MKYYYGGMHLTQPLPIYCVLVVFEYGAPYYILWLVESSEYPHIKISDMKEVN
jgi:hypothetical protein